MPVPFREKDEHLLPIASSFCSRRAYMDTLVIRTFNERHGVVKGVPVLKSLGGPDADLLWQI